MNWTLIIALIFGVGIGYVIRSAFANHDIPLIGVWNVNLDDPEKDIFRIELTDPAKLYSATNVRMKVIREKNTSHNGD